ncbi:hypothetical protein J1N35_001110 [Gossypium stocksii]|uniref:Uncharacterized protein n=1 Tax=Gossypium stocksii TaxID=47602 RepID=A0A9D3WH20_9ROSI|nr:hypothetical protein J1N35_001110 [Gossypium stocksii]
MLSAVEERVGKLEESMEDMKESNNVLRERIEDLRERSKDFVTMCLTYQRDSMQELLDSHKKKPSEGNDALEDMVKALKEETMATMMALSTRIEELKGELVLCQAAVGKDSQVWHLVTSMSRSQKSLWGQDVQKLSEAMMVVESVVKLGLGNDKLGSSKFEERGARELDHKEDNVNGNGNGNNGEMSEEILLSKKEKPVGKALGLGSSVRGVEAKKVENEKKLVECFLRHGLHR